MDFYGYKCVFSGCSQLAVCECSCSKNIRLCSEHLSQHRPSYQCYFINIQKKAISIAIMMAENALDQLNLKTYEKAKYMINEINLAIKKNNDFIYDIKAKLRNPISLAESPENIIKWTTEYSIENRSIDEYKTNVHYILSLNGDSEKIEAKLANEKKITESLKKVQNDNNAMEKKIKEMSQTIKTLENQLKNSQAYVKAPQDIANRQQPKNKFLGK